MNYLTEDKVRDVLQIILSIAENNIKECLLQGKLDLLGDLQKIVERTQELKKLLFQGVV